MNGQYGGRDPQGYAPTHYERVRGHHAFQSMAGPEFTGTGAVFAPIRALPVGGQLMAWAVLILVGMGGCTAAWIDQQDYVPSPNICRAHETTRTDCVQVDRPAQQVPAEGGAQGVAR
ncbi:hypothetical protein [Nocardia sp. X0981]